MHSAVVGECDGEGGGEGVGLKLDVQGQEGGKNLEVDRQRVGFFEKLDNFLRRHKYMLYTLDIQYAVNIFHHSYSGFHASYTLWKYFNFGSITFSKLAKS